MPFSRSARPLTRAALALSALIGTGAPSQAGFFDSSTDPAPAANATTPEVAPVLRVRRRVADLAQVRARVKRDMQRAGFEYGAPIFLRMFKQYPGFNRGAGELWVQKAGRYELYKRFAIASYSGKLGGKMRFGDYQAPEGLYPITSPDQFNPNSTEYLSINTGYPNARDRALGYSGDALMIHGGNLSAGCYAITDDTMEVVYAAADAAWRGGQRQIDMHLFPMPMTPANMNALAKQPEAKRWMPMWKQLQPAYAAFEATRLPPAFSIRGAQYAVLSHVPDAAPVKVAVVPVTTPVAPIPLPQPVPADTSAFTTAALAAPTILRSAPTPAAPTRAEELCRRTGSAGPALTACAANLRSVFEARPALELSSIYVRAADGSVSVVQPGTKGDLLRGAVALAPAPARPALPPLEGGTTVMAKTSAALPADKPASVSLSPQSIVQGGFQPMRLGTIPTLRR